MKDAIKALGSALPSRTGLPPRARTIEVAAAIAHPSTDLALAEPENLDAISARVGYELASGRLPSRSDLRNAAWCIWSSRTPLAANQQAFDQFLEYVRDAGRKGGFARLAAVYVIEFPRSEPSIQRVAETLRDLATRFTGPWSTAAKDLDLFDPEWAPKRIADLALRDGVSPSQVLAARGIGSLSSEGGLAEAVFLAGIDRLRHDRELSGLERLARVEGWSVRPNGQLLFEQHRAKVADALVLPYANEMPPKQVRDRYLSFLISRFEDPRLRPGRWSQMESTPIVRRWLIEQTLRQFLDVISKVALDKQFRYRRKFWEAIHAKGLIRDAWVIFDNEGASIAKQLFETETPYALWASKPLDKKQACMLLKIGRGVVAEWSHNGRCHVWHDETDPTAPRLDKRTYLPSDVRVASESRADPKRSSFVHNNSDRYHWQHKVAAEVAELTGYRLLESDFRI